MVFKAKINLFFLVSSKLVKELKLFNKNYREIIGSEYIREIGKYGNRGGIKESKIKDEVKVE